MDEKDQRVAQLLKRIEALEKLVKEQGVEMVCLKKQLGKNSNNRSKPPSMDGWNKPSRDKNKSLREAGKNKSGGQKGHPGETLGRLNTQIL